MKKFKIEEIEEIEDDLNIYYFGKIELPCEEFSYQQNKQKIDYFIKNKNKYLFGIKDNWIAVVDKEFALLNIDLSYKKHTEEFNKFIKYYLIKEKLYGKI